MERKRGKVEKEGLERGRKKMKSEAQSGKE